MKQIIIIPKEGDLYSCTFEENISHAFYYQKYAIQNSLPFLEELTDVCSCGKTFSLNDYLSIILDDYSINWFCPNYLSKQQYDWLKGKYSTFSKLQSMNIPFHAMICSDLEDEILDQEELNPLKQFYREIKKHKEDTNERTYSKK